jgi:hypothetical protein
MSSPRIGGLRGSEDDPTDVLSGLTRRNRLRERILIGFQLEVVYCSLKSN